jgi:glucokinase
MTIIAVDVGGTNVRFGIAETDKGPLTGIKNLICDDFPRIEDAINAYLKTSTDTPSLEIDAICIAVAAPVKGDNIDVTNNHWQFSKTALLEYLPITSLLVINDFTAQALAQTNPEASSNQLILEGASRVDAPLLVIGAGTGLGAATLIPTNNGYQVIEGEGGHVCFSPRDELEGELYAHLRKTRPYVSAEEVISGPGLERIYRFLCGREGVNPSCWHAAHIGSAALREKGLERQAALMLIDALATVVVNNVLTMGCWRGAVIAGGVVPRLARLIPESRFKERFLEVGVMSDALEDVPVWLATDTLVGLDGARKALANPNLASRVIAKTSSHRPEPATEVHRSQRQQDHDD